MIRIGSPEDHGLALDAIQIDGGTQSRATLNDHVVNDYAEAIKAGATFPPIVVFYDGKKHWLADGFHRFHAYQKIGREKVAADVRQGTRRDAILHSVGANETHGLRRTRDDKRRAVETLLNDPEWSKWSDREIARQCAVHHTFVGKLRPVTGDNTSEDRSYTTKHGTTATMKTAGINASRKNAREALDNDEPSPEAGPQAEASLAGTGAGTLADREGRHEGEAASVDLPTNPRDIVAEVRELWNLATPSEREEIRAFTNSPAPTHKSAGNAPRNEGSEGANMENDDVDGSTERAGHAGQPFDALTRQVEPGDSNKIVERNTSGPDAKRAPVSRSDGDAFSEVKGTARPENAAGVEPSLSDMHSQPVATDQNADATAADQAVAVSQAPRPSATAEVSHSSELSSSQALTDSPAQSSSLAPGHNSPGPLEGTVPGGEPGRPSDDAGGAKADDLQGHPGRTDDVSVLHNSQSSQAANPSKPGCLKLKDGHCKLSFHTDSLCSECNRARASA